MRILKLSDVYFPRVNGVSTAIRTFAREFVSAGHQVQLVAPSYPQAAPTEPFPITRLSARTLPLDPEDKLITGRAARGLAAQLRASDYDLIHIHTPFRAHYLGVQLARRWNLPVVETYHTYFEQYLGKYLPWLPGGLLRLAARRFSVSQADAVDALVVPSQPMLDVLRGYGVRARAEVIPTGLPDDELPDGDGARFRERHGIGRDRAVLLYVGRVAHEKNIDFLIGVTERLRHSHPDILLVIAGEGPATHALQRKVSSGGLHAHVRFIGYLDRGQELADCYACGDMFVFASDTETQGLVLLEAMKLGTPVVTTAVMGTAALMADRRGGLVAERDEDHFADQCRVLLDNPTERQRLAREARRKAIDWGAPAMAARLLTLYEEITRDHRNTIQVPRTKSEP